MPVVGEYGLPSHLDLSAPQRVLNRAVSSSSTALLQAIPL